MIRKPPADWNRLDESTAIRTVRTAAAVAKGGAEVARRGRQAVMGLVCCVVAAVWAFVVIGGLVGSLPELLGIGAMTAVMFWLGFRAIMKALAR
jgi:hypothetical protein